jgi:hypothetical protein
LLLCSVFSTIDKYTVYTKKLFANVNSYTLHYQNTTEMHTKAREPFVVITFQFPRTKYKMIYYYYGNAVAILTRLFLCSIESQLNVRTGVYIPKYCFIFSQNFPIAINRSSWQGHFEGIWLGERFERAYTYHHWKCTEVCSILYWHPYFLWVKSSRPLVFNNKKDGKTHQAPKRDRRHAGISTKIQNLKLFYWLRIMQTNKYSGMHAWNIYNNPFF